VAVISVLGVTSMLAAEAVAQPFPGKRPIRLVVGYSAGTAPDILARRIAEQMTEQLQVSVSVENSPGAGGRLAADVLKRAPADGHTLSVTVFGPYALLPFIEESNKIEQPNDFTPVSMLGRFDAVMAVAANSPWKSAKEMTAAMKASPGRYAVATPAVATVVNLAAERFRLTHGLDVEIAPYPKSALAMVDLTSGRLALAFSTVSIVRPFHDKGDAKVLAVTGPNRAAAFPDAPTLTELGLASSPTASWYGFFAPPGTPDAIVSRLNEVIAPLKNDATLRKTLELQGVEPVFSSPDVLAKAWEEDSTMWAELINTMKAEQAKK